MLIAESGTICRLFPASIVSFSQQLGANDASPTPHVSTKCKVNVPFVTIRCSLDDAQSLSIRSHLGAVECSLEVVDQLVRASVCDAGAPGRSAPMSGVTLGAVTDGGGPFGRITTGVVVGGATAAAAVVAAAVVAG